MSTVGIAQGVTSVFAVRQDYGIPPEGELYVCDDVAARGDLVFLKTEGHCALTSGDMAATATYLGFIEQDVVADNSLSIQFGYAAQEYTGSGVGATGDQVAIWRAGRFLLKNVVGSITVGAKVYPGTTNGSVSATQTGSAPAVGVCTMANTVSAGPVEAEIFLIGRKSL